MLGGHLDAAEADPVVGVRREAPRLPGTDAGAEADRAVVDGDDDVDVSTPRRARRAVATDASWNWVSASWLSGTHPRPARKVRSSDSASTAATAGFPSARVVRFHLGHRRNVIRSGGQATDSYDVVGKARTELARRAVAVADERSSQPEAPATGATTRSGNSANARTWASRGVTRNRGEGRGGTGLPETMSAMRIVTGGPPEDGRDHAHAVAPGRAHAEDVGHRRPAGRAGLPGQHPPDDHPRPDDMRAQALGLSGRRHAQRLGWAGPLDAARICGLKQEELVTYVIAQPCVDLKDRACVDECPVDCIYEGKRMLYIHPDECVDCGACEPVCPVEAIFYEDDTPEEWKGYYDANVHFFDDLGSPGGAAKLGEIDHDHELVAALPPQEHDE